MFRSKVFAGIILSTMLLSLAGHAQSSTAAASQGSPVSEQQLSKLRSGIIVRAAGDPPFHVKAMFTAKAKGVSSEGSYEETWIDPKHWRRALTVGEQSWVELEFDDKLYTTKMIDAATRPVGVAGVLLSGIPSDPNKLTIADLTMEGRAITKLSSGANLAWFFDRSTGAVLARKFGTQITNYTRNQTFSGRQVPLAVSTSNSVTGTAIEISDAVWETTSLDRLDAKVPDGAELVPAPSGAVRLSSGVVAGMRIAGKTPVYPPDAKRLHISGSVLVEVTIGPDGKVRDTSVVSGPKELQDAALDAVRTYVYTPYLVAGNPTEVTTQINVIFTLN